MCFKRNKFKKLTREDVVDAICKLEKNSKEIQDLIDSNNAEIAVLKAKGKLEKTREMRLLYAKKINAMQADNQQNIRRAMFLIHNISMLHRLKQAIDDNSFFDKTSAASLGNLLSDQVALSKFLTGVLQKRNASEETLVGAGEVFDQFDEMYEPSEAIYGKNMSDDELLATFEIEDDIQSVVDATEAQNEIKTTDDK